MSGSITRLATRGAQPVPLEYLQFKAKSDKYVVQKMILYFAP